MSHNNNIPSKGAYTRQDEDGHGQELTFSISDDASELAQVRENRTKRRHRKADDLVRMVEEKRDVVQLAAAGTQRLAAMNQLSAANLGMLACNATSIGHTIGATARGIAQQNQTIRKSAVAQSAATAALSLQAAAAHDEINHLAEAMAALALNAAELLDSLSDKERERSKKDNGWGVQNCKSEGTTRGSILGRENGDTAGTELAVTMALAEQTAVVARHMSDRVAALAVTFEHFTSHCGDIQEISEGLCREVDQLDVNDGELDKSKALIASLVHQIEVMVPPLRQIAMSCTGVTKNLTLTAEGLDVIRNKIFVRHEDSAGQRDAG